MSPKAVPASRHMAPRILAQARFEALPPRFQCSVVGIAYRHIIEQLADDGMAPLQPVLEHMFPGMDARQARRELSTRYINRPFKDAAGQVPLKLQMSRPSRKAGNSSQLWFEAEAALNPADLTPVNPRYSAAGFEDMRATQATSTQMAAALEAARRAPSGSDDAQTPAPATRDVLALALAESALHDPVAHKAFKGLRQDVGEDFEGGGQARRSAGMTPMDDDKLAPAKKSARKAGPQGDAADTVNCLDAMLQWAKPQPPSPHRLLCLLGDYGTGKTSHCYQFCRVLNREAGHALWPGGSGNTMPAALYVDLAELAGVSTLADLSLAQLLTTVLNKSYTGDTSTLAAEVQQQLTLARVGQLVLVFDGLDELLKNDRAVLHKVFDQLLRVLEPSPQQKARGQGSLARVIVSCRTHYFRAVEDQHGFFNTRQRGVASSGDYLCLSLLPWEPRNIESYLGKRLPPDQAQELLHIIRTTYNLQELASRPVLLAMMGEQLGSLLRLRQAGEPITAARLYDITVGEWVQRDSGKHRISPHHKALLMGALAAAMWSEGVEAWTAEQLDRWLLRTVEQLFPRRYAVDQAEAIQDDLRTATFIVRPGAERFSFAHRSFLEYFLARFVVDALALCETGALDQSALLALLPTRVLNHEASQFLRESCASQLPRLGSDGLRRRSLPLWQLLQGQPGQESLPVARRAALWQLALNFDVTASMTQVVSQQTTAALFDPQARARLIDLGGVDLSGQQWQDQDFTWLPPLDLRGANLLRLRAHRCRFGQVLCDGQTNWGQAMLRDCDTSGISWGASDRGGLLVRSSHIARALGRVQSGAAARIGPWTQPMAKSGFASVAFHPEGGQVLSGGEDGTLRLWDIGSGRELRRFEGHRDAVWSVAFHPKGGQVLSGGVDGTLRLWDSSSGQELRRFEGHRDAVTSVAFHPGGGQLLSGGRDGTLRLWDSSSGQELRRFAGHDGWVTSVAFHPKGGQVLSGGDDGTLRLWRGVGATDAPYSSLRLFVHGSFGPSSAEFDAQGNLLAYDDEAADSWLFCLANGTPEPVEMASAAPNLQALVP